MKTSFMKGTFYLTISTGIFIVTSYVINIWLGRHLGPESYGIYGIIISVVTLINLTQTAGLPQAVSKFISTDPENVDAIFRASLFLQLISTIVAGIVYFLCAGVIASLLHDLQLKSYLQASSLIIPFYGLFILTTAFYNGLHLFRKQAFIYSVYSIVKFIVIIGASLIFGVYGVIVGFTFSPVVALFFGFRIPKKTPRIFPYRKLILFSLPLIIFAIASNLLQSIDLFFVKSLIKDDSLTGIYTANQNIAEIPFYIVTALTAVLFPSISRSISHQVKGHTQQLIKNALRLSLFILLPSISLLAATSNQALAFLYSAAYAPGAASLTMLALGSGFFTFFIILTTIISSSGSPQISSILSLLGLIINSLLCAVLIPPFGLLGASIAMSVTSVIVMLLSSYIVYKKFRVFISYKTMSKLALATLVIFFIAKIIILPGFLLLLFYLLLFILFFLLLFFMKEITADDINHIHPLLPKWILNRFNL